MNREKTTLQTSANAETLGTVERERERERERLNLKNKKIALISYFAEKLLVKINRLNI